MIDTFKLTCHLDKCLFSVYDNEMALQRDNESFRFTFFSFYFLPFIYFYSDCATANAGSYFRNRHKLVQKPSDDVTITSDSSDRELETYIKEFKIFRRFRRIPW